MIYPLVDCQNFSVKDVGNKSIWLSKVIHWLGGEFVPKGICLNSKIFNQFLNSNGSLRKVIANKLAEIEHTPIVGRKKLFEIRELIKHAAFPQDIINQVLMALVSNNLQLAEGVAVRSSSSYEDSMTSAYAGTFSTELYITNKEQLIQAIKNVWASGFSEVVLYNHLASSLILGIPVIIQQMTTCQYHGVLFTKNPANETAQEMLLELSTEVKGIVEGSTPFLRKTLPATGDLSSDDNWNGLEKELLKLRDFALQLVEKAQTEVDLELGIEQDKLIILQCRPISTLLRPADYWIVEQDDAEKCAKIDLAQCASLYRRYVGKQLLFRRVVRDLGFDLYRQIYVVYRKDKYREQIITDISKWMRTHQIIIDFGSHKSSIKCTLDELAQILRQYNVEQLDDLICVRIGEMIVAELSGYSSVVQDDKVLVEYVPGRMGRLRGGNSDATRVLMEKDEVSYLNNPVHKYIDSVDADGNRCKIEYNKLAPPLTDNQIASIAMFTREVSAHFNNARLEWYYSGDVLFGKDISIEEADLVYTSKTVNILSNGAAYGKCVHLTDVQVFDYLADQYDISLVPHSELEEQVYNDNLYQEIVGKLREIGQPIIVLAPRPSLGHMLIADYVSGFVFKQGAVLSHVGICLREKGVPALIDPNLKQYKDGDIIQISPLGIRRC